jgi:hypothetical protein
MKIARQILSIALWLTCLSAAIITLSSGFITIVSAFEYFETGVWNANFTVTFGILATSSSFIASSILGWLAAKTWTKK